MWIRRVRRGLVTMAALLAAAALVATVRPTSVDIASLRLSLTSLHKPLGASLTALLLATLLSPRLWQSARRGSILALYVTLFLAATVLMLGPDAHVMGTRVWYKAPLSWFVTLPGFDSLRVPARWATIQVLAGAVVIALVARRVIDSPSSFRRRWVPIAAGVAIAAEGWLILPIADLPPTLPAAIDAELVVELPSRGPGDDIAAMYRGIRHGARVVNGFSGHEPPHYRLLMTDIQSGCLASLDALRGGRSLDVVLHNERDSAAEIRQAIERQWPAAPRQDAGTVTRWHVDASPSRATTAYADPIELRGICPSRDDDRSASR